MPQHFSFQQETITDVKQGSKINRQKCI